MAKEIRSLWVKTQEAADLLGVDYQVVWKACKNGRLPYKRVGHAFLIPRTAIDPSTAEFEIVQKN